MIRNAACFRCGGKAKYNSKAERRYIPILVCYNCMCEKSEITKGDYAPKLPDKQIIEQLEAELEKLKIKLNTIKQLQAELALAKEHIKAASGELPECPNSAKEYLEHALKGE